MKPEIFKLKNMRGRVTGYGARLGNIEVGGYSTPTAAREAWEREATLALSAPSVLVMHDLYQQAPDRAVWILECHAGAWGYRIARPVCPGSHYDGHSGAMLTTRDRREAEDSMKQHWYSNNVAPFVDMLRALAGF